MTSLEDDLRAAIARNEVLVIAGAGIAMAGSENASVAAWRGLLEDGIERCVKACGASRNWASAQLGLLRLPDVSAWIAVGEQVTEKLGGPRGGEFKRWLRETVGQLEPTAAGSEVLAALVRLNTTIATTNYDGLLEHASRLQAVTWREDGSVAQRVFRGDSSGIVHLHGYWDEPSTVVLGVRSYESILGHGPAQAMQRALVSTKTLLLVGFGGGLEDPNFHALRKWMAQTWSGGEYRHYRLVLERDLEAAQNEHRPDERIVPVAFGSEHRDLLGFLHRIAPPGAPLNRIGIDGAAGSLRVSVEQGRVQFERSNGLASTVEVRGDGELLGIAPEVGLRLVGEGLGDVSRTHLAANRRDLTWAVTDLSKHGTWEERADGVWKRLRPHRPVRVTPRGMRLRIAEGVILRVEVQGPTLSGPATPDVGTSPRRP
jgi:hypothetical protein